MNTSTAQLLIWTGADAACIRVTGRANFAASVDFRKALRRLREAGFSRVLLDLSECQAMDSTFLGVLAQEASRPAAAPAAPTPLQLELLNTPEAIRETITDLGVAGLVEFVERDPAQIPFAPAAHPQPATREELTRTSLEAHEVLMALHPANVARFKDVARFLAGELETIRQPEPQPPGET